VAHRSDNGDEARRGEARLLVFAGPTSISAKLGSPSRKRSSAWRTRSRSREPKTRRGRRKVALDQTTVRALRAHRARQLEERLALGDAHHDRDLVFAEPDGTCVHPDGFGKAFKRLQAAAGVPVIRFHDVRHTHATLALQAGVHPKVVSERLGHSTVSITLDTYSHVLPGLQEEAAQRMAPHRPRREEADLRRSSCLNARAEHGFQSQVRPDEQVRVGDQPSDAAKTMDGTRRFVQQRGDLLGQVEAAGQRLRVERPEPRWVFPNDSPGV